MSTLKAIWKNGVVVLEGRADWPEGCRLIIQDEFPAKTDVLMKDEQSDESKAIQRLVDERRTIPAVPRNSANAASSQATIRDVFLEAELGGES